MNRRHLFRFATAVAAFQSHALERVRAATRRRRNPHAGRDRHRRGLLGEIRDAFSVDRNIVNFNNGYFSPSPRAVQDAMRRYLEYSDMGPYHTMVNVLERQVETVRRRLAQAAGCDPEEMAITRNSSESLENAQYGIDLQARRRSADHQPGLSAHADHVPAARAPRRHRAQDHFVSGAAALAWTISTSASSRRSRRKTKLILVCHITNRTGQIFPSQADLPDGACAQHPGDRGRRARLQPFPLQDLRPGLRLLRRQPAQVDLRADRHRLPVRAQESRIASTWPLMAADTTQDDDIRKFEEIGTHPAANHNAISEALVFNENLGIDRKAARLRYLRDRWANRLAQNPKCRSCTAPTRRNPAASDFWRSAGVDGGKMRETLVEQVQHPDDLHAPRGV